MASVTIYLKIDDARALREAAEERALEEGVAREDWRKTRTGSTDDLRMLFDPGLSPPGCSILDSSAETDEDDDEPEEEDGEQPVGEGRASPE